MEVKFRFGKKMKEIFRRKGVKKKRFPKLGKRRKCSDKT